MVFCHQMEYRRLMWERGQLFNCRDEDGYSVDPEAVGATTKAHELNHALAKAKKKVEVRHCSLKPIVILMLDEHLIQVLYNSPCRCLQWERKYLALQLKYSLNEVQREKLYQQWGVKLTEKGRKLKLINKLWSEEPLGWPNINILYCHCSFLVSIRWGVPHFQNPVTKTLTDIFVLSLT